ncbi:restriction endonuclease subunit S [Lactobacillus crispatus]|uniref:restriction endonuclease subunit S n=1 Tax=Lactobacillus crispatus TaxID=47770 RepID=UPI0018E3D725|nr:restriction endonuclease subunit S [Lactobacillus crispatus]MBI1695920.1 type I restriction-modification system specificity protein [Lactobacillus crispatus]
MKYKLSDCVEIISGGTPKKAVSEYWDGNIPWITIKDFGSKYPKSTDNYITQEGLNHSAAKLSKDKDILISARGTVGEVMMVHSGYTFNQSIYGLRIKEKVAIPEYIYYWLLANKQIFIKNVHGSVFDTITRKIFDHIQIELPCIANQAEIVSKLNSIDSKIALNELINDNLLELAKASYRKVLAASNLTETKLKDFATITMGQSPSSKTYNEDKVGLALLNGAADFRNGIHPSKWTTDPKRIVNKGSYIFGVRATIGLTTKVFDKYAIGRGTGSAVSKDTVNDEFLYFVLDDMFKYFSNSGSGSVYINISKSDFNDYIFCKPQTNDLQKFHQTVGPIMNKIYTNKQENLILTQVKETLLNKYF